MKPGLILVLIALLVPTVLWLVWGDGLDIMIREGDEPGRTLTRIAQSHEGRPQRARQATGATAAPACASRISPVLRRRGLSADHPKNSPQRSPEGKPGHSLVRLGHRPSGRVLAEAPLGA